MGISELDAMSFKAVTAVLVVRGRTNHTKNSGVYKVGMCSSGARYKAVSRDESPLFLAYVCITPDAERGRTRSKAQNQIFQKIDFAKIQNLEIGNFRS